MATKVLITGVAGFIGSHLARRLVGLGYSVVGLDNFDPFYDPAVKRRNLCDLLDKPNFQLVEADIREQNQIGELFQKNRFEIVVHLAAKAGVRPSIENPVGYADVNVNGTVVVLEAARQAGVSRFIFASSSSVYGNSPKVPFSETDNVDNPISPYAATKKAGELLCYTYHHLYQMSVWCLRFFTVYGPGQRPDLAIHKFAGLIWAGKPVPVYGDGSMERDFTYIDDVIDGVVVALQRCSGYAIYNLGNSCPVRVDRLVELLERILGKKAVIEWLPEQAGDVKRTYADIRRAQRDLNFFPKTPLSEGLARFVEWFYQQRQERQMSCKSTKE